MKIAKILIEALEKWASDVILTSSVAPVLKLNWDIVYLEHFWIYEPQELKEEILATMSEKQKNQYLWELELDYSLDLKWYSRFRVNSFFSKAWAWAVFRPIKTQMPTFEELNLPKKLLDFAPLKRWLLLVTWWVWSWKSTTMSAFLDYIIANYSRHIITVEDPIEYVFKNGKSVIEQREVWTNTKTFDSWLKYALRQASDVILIWEMRDLETFRLALRAAETWNLVIWTMHTSWAANTVSRIVDMFPWNEKEYVRAQLAESLLWVIWQQLIKWKDWKWRVLATELLVNNSAIANMIRKWDTHQIPWALETWWSFWMYTMEKNLEMLREQWLID